MTVTNLSAAPSSHAPFWYGVRIDDPELAFSTSFRRLMSKALRLVPCNAVRVTKLEVVFKYSEPELKRDAADANAATVGALKDALDWPLSGAYTGPVLAPASLDEMLDTILQFVWGRFFFYTDVTAANRVAGSDDLLLSISQSSFTICIQDNMRYIVFSKSFPLACVLLSENQPAEVQKDSLEAILRRQGEL